MENAMWRTAGINSGNSSRLACEADIPLRIARLLLTRGIESKDEMSKWLNADYDWSAPDGFREMPQAVDRLQLAIARGEQIAVVGDYDVDGVTATAILASALKRLGASVICDIPDRVRDGYGLSIPIVRRVYEQGARLLVTVDNGVRANEAIAHAVQCGIDVILTDHHEPGDELPQGQVATIHYELHESPHIAKHLSGAGVSWKLTTALFARLMDGQRDEELSEWIIGLATLGALADVMPMQGENRLLVRKGINALSASRRPGWLALCEVAKVSLVGLTEQQILWRISPRVNAAGRVGHATVALQLLMSDNMVEARRLAEELERLNELRRMETERAASEAREQVVKYHTGIGGVDGDRDASSHQSAVVVKGAWNPGVVGIVAARLAEEFECPALVFADSGELVLKGSGRAPEGFSLFQALTECEDVLHHYGGHAAAVGCGVNRDQFQTFCEVFSQVAATHSDSYSMGAARLPLSDDYLPIGEVTIELCDWLQQFAPHGPDNPDITFFVGPVEIVAVTPMSSGKHLRIRVSEGNKEIDLTWFGASPSAHQWNPGDRMVAIVTLTENVWQGTRKPQLQVRRAWSDNAMISRREFVSVYRKLREKGSLSLAEIARQTPEFVGEVGLSVIFTAFCELGFAECKDSAYHRIDASQSVDLRESISYQNHLRLFCSI